MHACPGLATVVVGSGVTPGTRSATNYNHYSLVKTIESGWGLPTLTTNDAGAAAMLDLFGSAAPTPSPAGSVRSRRSIRR